MTHLKRLAIPRTWPLPRKGCKYIIRPLPGRNINFCLPAAIVLREILKIANTRKEIKKILQSKEVLVNGKVIKKESSPIGFFDNIMLPKIKRFYRLVLNERGKLALEEISEEEAFKKYLKIINRTILRGNKIQLNFHNGNNLIVEKGLKADINDCIVFDLKSKKILKIIPFEKGSCVRVIAGKHSGKRGFIEKIEDSNIIIKTATESIKANKESLFVCEK